MHTHYQAVPHGHLLTLCCPNDPGGLPLADTLQQAVQSDQPSIWVDCRRVATLPTEVQQQLRHCATQLWQAGGHLILCHLSAAMRTGLAACATQPLAAAALDAELYGLPCP